MLRRPATPVYRCLILIVLALAACGERRERRLDGEWEIHLAQEKPYGGQEIAPLADTTSGAVYISPEFPGFPKWIPAPPPEMRPYALGRFFVDLNPLRGRPPQPDSARPRPGIESEAGSWAEVMAWIAGADSVNLSYLPNVADGGVELFGHMRGDTITGTWKEDAYCCGASGRFRMWRRPRSAAMDSAIAYARRGVYRPSPLNGEYTAAAPVGDTVPTANARTAHP